MESYNYDLSEGMTPKTYNPPLRRNRRRRYEVRKKYEVDVKETFITSPPEGVARYCFHPVCLSVCLSVCLCVCVSVCPANILVFYFSAIRRDIDLKFIQDTYSVVLNSLE